MDRNLGARDVNRNENGSGVLLWQVGRISPFPGGPADGISTSGYLGTTKVEYHPTNFLRDVTTTNKKVTIRAAVSQPLTYYIVDNTVTGSTYNWSSELVTNWAHEWLDIKVARFSKNKSIFDPSPAGWRLPRMISVDVGAYSDFSYDRNTVQWISNENVGGLYRNFAYIAASGRRRGSLGNIYAREDICLWHSSAFDSKGSTRLVMSRNAVHTNIHHGNVWASSARCVSM